VAYVANAGLFELVSVELDFDGAQSSQLGVAVGTLMDRTGTYGVLLLPGSAFGLPYQRITIAAP
jgi:hypothetical protein